MSITLSQLNGSTHDGPGDQEKKACHRKVHSTLWYRHVTHMPITQIVNLLERHGWLGLQWKQGGRGQVHLERWRLERPMESKWMQEQWCCQWRQSDPSKLLSRLPGTLFLFVDRTPYEQKLKTAFRRRDISTLHDVTIFKYTDCGDRLIPWLVWRNKMDLEDISTIGIHRQTMHWTCFPDVIT